jgi:hypothetical protein
MYNMWWKVYDMKFSISSLVSTLELSNIFVRVWFQKYTKQCRSVCTMTLETVCKIYPRCWHLNGNSYSARRIYLS